MVPGKARDAGKGVPLAKFRNAAWGHLPRNPSGRVSFCAGVTETGTDPSLVWLIKDGKLRLISYVSSDQPAILCSLFPRRPPPCLNP